LINIDKVQILEPTNTDKIFVLFLPLNEIHQLGLMYINYEIISSGYRTIYLGESIPVENLKDLKKYFTNIVYITYLTVEPQKKAVNDYVKIIQQEILNDHSELWLIGLQTEYLEEKNLNTSTKKFQSISALVNEL